MRRAGFTLIEMVLALGLAALLITAAVTVLAQGTITARLTTQADQTSRIKRLILNELAKGNATLAGGGTWNYGELGGVLLVDTPEVNRFRLEVSPQGTQSLAGGGVVYAYDYTLCHRPTGAAEEVCQSGRAFVPPPAASQEGVGSGSSAQLIITGEDPTGAANVEVEVGDGTISSFTRYGNYILFDPKRVRAKEVLNAKGIRFAPTVASGSGSYLVHYAAKTGAIDLRITASDPGFPIPKVSLSGPKSGQFDESTYLSDMPPGNYTLSAPTKSFKGYTFSPRYSGSASITGNFSLGRGEVATPSVVFVPTDGQLKVSWSGGSIPPPRLRLVRRDASGETQVATFKPPKALSQLQPASYMIALDGRYEVRGVEYGLEFQVFDPNTGRWSDWFKPPDGWGKIPVVEGETAQIKARPFAKTAVLTIEIDAPGGSSLSVKVGAPMDPETGKAASWRFTAPGTYTLKGLIPGTYGISADIAKLGDAYYVPSYTETLTLRAGDRKTVRISYNQVTEGTLLVWQPFVSSGGGAWPNEPLAFSVDGTTYDHPRAVLIPPGASSRVCGEDRRGEYISYKFAYLKSHPSDTRKLDCDYVLGATGTLEVKTLQGVYYPYTTYVIIDAHLAQNPPSTVKPSFAALLEDDRDPPRTYERLECDKNDFVKPIGEDYWVCSRSAQWDTVQGGQWVDNLSFVSNTIKTCQIVTLDVTTYAPNQEPYTDTKERANTRAILSKTYRATGRIYHATLKEVCP